MFSKLFTTVKYSLVAVNVLFVITGIITFSVGMFVYLAYNEYHVFLSDSFFSLSNLCMATGLMIIFMLPFTFHGVFMVFGGAVVCIFQLIGCIVGYILRGNAVSIIHQQLSSTIDLYGTGVGKNVELTAAWDAVQRGFSCCGVVNATDWLLLLNTTENQGLPISCCPPVPGTIYTMDCVIGAGANQIGCADAFGDFVGSHAGSIAVAGVFLFLMQILITAMFGWLDRRMSKVEEVELKQ